MLWKCFLKLLLLDYIMSLKWSVSLMADDGLISNSAYLKVLPGMQGNFAKPPHPHRPHLPHTLLPHSNPQDCVVCISRLPCLLTQFATPTSRNLPVIWRASGKGSQYI